MKRSLKFTFFLLAVFANTYSYSQFSIKGKIIDVRTKEPLAFVNIIFNNNSHSGTTTDIDGKFYFNQSQKISSICCTYVGYEKLTISPDSLKKDNKGFIIELKPDVLNLQEIVVVPGENPANRIIRKVIQNKEINNPENISSFKYTSYNKSIYDFEPNDTLDSDSIRIRMNKLFKGGHLLIMESVTERKYISPDINEEIITGAKVSGFKHPSFAPLATDLQPFTFYKDNIKMLEINYLNPISNGSLKKYLFKITDTLYQNTDTVFILSFKPIKGTNIQGLTGLLYINTKPTQYKV
jgi:hypothetical protein